jgi:TonB family protein
MLKVKLIIISIALFTLGCSSTKLVPVDENIVAPLLIDKPLFVYPHSAQENDITGKVFLIMKVDEEGKIESVMLEKSSGSEILDQSAIAFVKQFKYKPAELNGKPIQFYLKQSVDYMLADKKDQAYDYIKHIKNLQNKIKNTSAEKQLELQKELLAVYIDFINSNLDFVVFNQNIKELVHEKSYSRWNKSITEWPLHFIVFDDFQKSYPNSSVDDDARKLMFEYLKKDFDTVKVISNLNDDRLYQKEKFSTKIHSFLNEEYAGLLPDSLDYLIQ